MAHATHATTGAWGRLPAHRLAVMKSRSSSARVTHAARVSVPRPPRSVRLVEGAGTAEGEPGPPGVEWAGDSRWMEVSIGLVGGAGAMRPLGPTLRLPSQVRHWRRAAPPGKQSLQMHACGLECIASCLSMPRHV